MPYTVPHVQVVPQPDDQLSFQVDASERLRWHFAPRYPRPFFFPVLGPCGRSLTRMGHPAAPDHDHHRSLWWGHQSVAGVNFWEERGGTQQIRQDGWIHYQDGGDEAGMVVRLGWYDAHKVRLLQQQLIAVCRPLPGRETWLELQTHFLPILDELKLGKTNFGFLGLRVTASLSEQYGDGQLTSSAGTRGEKSLFAKTADWMDYSGPIVGTQREGITFLDHPDNPGSPVSWHVRGDGWMSPAFNLREGHTLKKKSPLVLRYALHIHAGDVDAKAATVRHKEFASSRPWEVVAGSKPWRVTLRRKK
jgi:hypothetical protein